MSASPAAPIGERLALFEGAASYALEVFSHIRAVDLDCPTPCPDWNVRAVVLHIADVADAIIGLAATGQLTLPTPRQTSTPAPVAVGRQRIGVLHDTLRTLAAQPEQSDLFLAAAQSGANELAAHGWDIATALRLTRPIPDATAAALLRSVEGHLDGDTRGENFAPAVPVRPDATRSDRFIAYLGRQPT